MGLSEKRSWRGGIWGVFCVCLAGVGWCAEAPALDLPANDVTSCVLSHARQILAQAKNSRYSHRTHVEETSGVYHFDCSGLVVYLLKKDAPRALSQVPKGGHKRPLALQFYETFSSVGTSPTLTAWERVGRLRDARPGDILAWRRDKIIPGENTGHVVIIEKRPVEQERGLFRVEVVDSTGTAHFQDSRAKGQTGIGRGTMWFVADKAGAPVGYRWRLEEKPAMPVAIAIGRLRSK